MKLLNHRKSPSQFSSNCSQFSTKQRPVYRYITDWKVSQCCWLKQHENSLCLALSSFIETYGNHVQLVSLNRDSSHNDFKLLQHFLHPYPTTKISSSPDMSKKLLATSADYLRIWEYGRELVEEDNKSEIPDTSKVYLKCLLQPAHSSRFCSPLTSFDWNTLHTNLIVTSSYDSTCVLWDIRSLKQISSHQMNSTYKHYSTDYQIYDIAFSRLGSGKNSMYCAVADGSIRSYDTRIRGTSRTLFDSSTLQKPSSNLSKPLVKVRCNNLNTNLLAVLPLDSDQIIILDLRKAKEPVALLKESGNIINCIEWAPHLANYICCGSSRNKALIWDISRTSSIDSVKPLLEYAADGGVNTISWSRIQPDWISIGFENSLELLRV